MHESFIHTLLLLWNAVNQGEFRVSPRSFTGKYIEMRIAARHGDFYARPRMRRGTSDMNVFSQVFLKREYAILGQHGGVDAAYQQIIEKGTTPLILDLGANIGLATLYLAKNWPKSRIIAVEPSLSNYEMLRHNAAGRGTIIPILGAVGAEDGKMKIVNPDDEAWKYRTEYSDSEAGVIQAFSIASLLAMAEGCVPFMAKIDIEGFEDNLFSRHTEWVSRFPVIVCELHDWLFPAKAVSANFLRAITPLNRDFVSGGQSVVSIDTSSCPSSAQVAGPALRE